MTTSTDQILSRILDELTELKVKNSHLEAKVRMLKITRSSLGSFSIVPETVKRSD